MVNDEKAELEVMEQAELHATLTDIAELAIEQVDSFPYLGSLITEYSYCSKEIRARLWQRPRFQLVYEGIVKTQEKPNINTETKIQLRKTSV